MGGMNRDFFFSREREREKRHLLLPKMTLVS